jgi:predicted dehydrogenase
MKTGKIRLGMVGGGQGAFIGAVHRLAARMDDEYELVAGALSSDAKRAKASGMELGLAQERIYTDYRAMAKAEAARPDGIEVVSIVTPNHMHVPISKAFIEAGIHVICDKPLCLYLKEAMGLKALLKKKPKIIFGLTHNYSGYPMIRQMKDMIATGAIGDVLYVQVEYAQGWLATPLEKTGQKQAAWRTDPKQTGAGGAVGDIGTHAMQLAGFVTDLSLDSVSADLTSFVKGRKVDDNVSVMMRYKGGAKGMLWASQIAIGNENALTLRVYGNKGGFDWAQENPNYLGFTEINKTRTVISRGGAGANAAAARVTRVPFGHPEGYLEGFANIYTEAARAIKAARSSKKASKDVTFPGIEDGIAGMAFIEACVKSSKANGKWVKV